MTETLFALIQLVVANCQAAVGARNRKINSQQAQRPVPPSRGSVEPSPIVRQTYSRGPMLASTIRQRPEAWWEHRTMNCLFCLHEGFTSHRRLLRRMTSSELSTLGSGMNALLGRPKATSSSNRRREFLPTRTSPRAHRWALVL